MKEDKGVKQGSKPQGQIAQLVQKQQMPLDSDEDEISDEEIVQGVISTDENQMNPMKQQNHPQS